MEWTFWQSHTADEPCGEIWTAGYVDESGRFFCESDWGSESEARDRADVLNAQGDDPLVMRPKAGHPIPDSLLSSMT
jgi:hypothetical protein